MTATKNAIEKYLTENQRQSEFIGVFKVRLELSNT